MFGPAAFAAFSDHEGGRIDDAVLEPTEEGALADGEQAGDCGIREAIPCCRISDHRYQWDVNTKQTPLQMILVTKTTGLGWM